MSDESSFNNQGHTRSLTEAEVRLLRFLLSSHPAPEVSSLDSLRVIDMNDGGMGSVRFSSEEKRRFGKTLVEGEYTDSDGVLVSIAVNLDTFGQLFEMDFWKVDFSPLRRYPQPSEVKVKAS